MSMRHFTIGMICTIQSQAKYNTQKRETNMYTCNISIILSTSTEPIKQSQQNYVQPIFEHHIFKTQQILKIQEIKGYNHEIF